MDKYTINLPQGKTIKYRVKKNTSDWVLIEAIISPKLFETLTHFAKVESIEDVTVVDEAVKETPQAAPQVKPVEKESPSISEKKELPTVTLDFTADQISEMKKIKDLMKLKSNDDLNPFIQDWSFGQGKSWNYLKKENIDEFIAFMRENYLVEE